jgi:cis-3-alkyl-4-acyloxetan-2-one decarboxylase
MTQSKLSINGIDVFIEGTGAHTVVMVHGWPDTHRLWDASVQALQTDYRCVRFSLPGFDLDKPARATSLADMTALFNDIVNAVCPNEPVTLLLHDWGCIFGYEYAAQHAVRVARIIAVDIGDHNTSAFHRCLNNKAKRMIFAYQVWLAVAWKLGGFLSRGLGNWMTRFMARSMGCPTAPQGMGWQMNYPYAMQWFKLKDGFRSAKRITLHRPLLFIYGARKPFMFHSPQWLDQIAARADCEAQAFKTGHWVMVQQPEAFNQSVLMWLRKTDP